MPQLAQAAPGLCLPHGKGQGTGRKKDAENRLARLPAYFCAFLPIHRSYAGNLATGSRLISWQHVPRLVKFHHLFRFASTNNSRHSDHFGPERRTQRSQEQIEYILRNGYH